MAKDVRRALMIARKPRQDGGSYRASDVRPGGWGASLENTHTKPTLMGMRPDQLTKIARGMPGYAHLQQAAQDFMADNPQAPVSETVHDILQRQDMGHAYSNGGRTKEERRALMIARDQRALLRRIANIYPGPGGGMDPSPGGGGYSGPGGGKYIGPSHYADGGEVVPLEPGKAAVPKGRVRRFHYTDAKNVPHILKEGIQLSKSTGLRVGDPVAVWSTPDNPYEHSVPHGKALVEFHDAPETYTRHPYASPNSVPPENIMAAHMPWHSHYRYALQENLTPEDLRGVQGEEYQQAADALERTKRATGGKVPPFRLYSGAAKVIAAKGQAKATPQQYAAMPGIKPDELKYSNFDMLGSKALPKEQVLEHLKANKVPLREKVLQYRGDISPPSSDDEMISNAVADQENGPRFKKNTLPRGEKYREVVLHLPSAYKAADEFIDSLRKKYGQGPLLKLPLTEYERKRFDELTDRADDPPFQHNHWPGIVNPVAHVRMSDRVGPNGEKILHLEEAQSDWGQQGRVKGFGEREGKVEQQPGGFWRITWPDGTFSGGYDTQTSAETALEYRGKGVPHGPYVDNTQKWTDLALKRVLHEAAHGGYDKIVVTPGDEQNKRYDLSSQVKNIQYYPDTKYLGATTHDNRGVEHEGVEPDDLSKHIGKEAADRILKQPLQRFEGRGKLGGEFYHELEGEGLKVGGEGMRGYYDNILPKRLQALAQQHDPQAKVNLHAHDVQNAARPWRASRYMRAANQENDIAAGNTREELMNTLRGQGQLEPSGEFSGKIYQEPGTMAHSLDVTPQMRDSIKANGFNSFKRGGDVDVAKKPSTPAIKKTLDLRPAEAFPELATRYPKTAPPEWAFDPKKKVDYLAKRLSPEALAVQTAKKVIQKDIEEGRYKPYFDPLKRYDASSPEFGAKTPTTNIKKVKPETQAKYDTHARSPEAIQRLSKSFERGMLQPREASDWYLMGQLHNEYVAKHGPKIGSQLFKERFADAMSATTGGADPTSNFLTSHYGNYVKAHKQQFPEKSYDLPFPIGGRYIGGNIDQFNKMIMQGKGVTPANPKRYNFSHNFLGDASGSTIDEQMSGQFDPKMTVPPEGTYGHYEEALADLAKQTKGAKSPRHFQEVAWAGAKDLGTKGGYRASPMISHINQSVERTSRLTGLSPDEVVAQNLVDVKGPMFQKGGAVGRALDIARKINGR